MMLDSEEILERIVEMFNTGRGRPFMLELRPTNRCNLRGPSCIARGYPPYVPGEELSAEEYERIIDEAAGLGVRYVQISGGGEPFMWGKKLLRIMHCVKQHGRDGFVATNGTLLDPSSIQELFDMRWDALLFSVDGHNPPVNDFLRGKKGCFEKSTSAIRAFARLKEQSRRRTPRLDLAPVLSHYNCRSIVEIVRLGADLGVGRVLISGGGEPLLSPATLPMMALFKRHGVYARMITNGSMWNDANIRATVGMGWDQVTFSIDGPNAKVHDTLRAVPGCFGRAVSAIRTFGKVREELESDAPRLEINCVLSRANYSAVQKRVEFAVDLGISYLNLEPVCINNPDVESMRLREKERRELQENLLPDALQAAEEHNLSTNIRGLMDIGNVERAGEMRGFILDQLRPTVPDKPFLELACYEPWLWPKIEANGDVWPCSTNPLKENIMEKSFSEIWNGEQFREFRRLIMNRDLPENCQNCVVSHLTTNNDIRTRLRGEDSEA